MCVFLLRKQLHKWQRVPGQDRILQSCVCVGVYSEAYVCVRVSVSVSVGEGSTRGGGGAESKEFGHPSAIGYFATVSAGAHILTHTCGARCQASCSLAGAGSAPERVVASICSSRAR